MKLLLHICCAPCSIYVIGQCSQAGNQLTGFYFNPNIHPYQEYLNRRKAVEAHSKDIGLDVIYPGYAPDSFSRNIADNKDRPMRCRVCWKMRLEKAALYAKENGFDAFSTTLLISPYQDHAAVKAIGEELAVKLGVSFYYRDFRKGFRASQLEARRQNLYLQKYCGCIYSKTERSEKKVLYLSSRK
jgi:hypothetical protein